MKTKKHPLLWIVLIVVALLAGAFKLYPLLGLNRPAPDAKPTVARGKIPPMPPAPVTMPAGQASSLSEGAQSATMMSAAEAARAASTADAAGSSPNSPPAVPVFAATAHRQKIADRVEPQNPQPGVSPAVPETTAAQASEPSGSPDSQQPGSSPSRSQPTAAAQKGQTVGALAPDDRPAADPVALQPSPAQQKEPDPPTPFSVQVGAYLTKAYADQMAAQLLGKGYDAYIFQRTDKKRRVWRLVRFGRFPNREAAAKAMKAFKDQEHMDAKVAISNAI